jgi:hypothetical protein
LIRSKGVGIFFITQIPADIPDVILSQLGLKVQHALRAFTAKDRKAIKLASENFPISEFYDIDQVLTQMGIGEAFVTALNEKGVPTPLAHTYMRAPQSRMDILTGSEIESICSQSKILKKYEKIIDRESAYEILSGKIEEAQSEDVQRKLEQQHGDIRHERKEKSTIEKVLTSTTTRAIGSTVAREITRGLLGVLGIKTSTRRTTTRKKGWFF